MRDSCITIRVKPVTIVSFVQRVSGLRFDSSTSRVTPACLGNEEVMVRKSPTFLGFV